MPSNLQLEANRKNAQSSTGPTSAEGKLRSSLNATRHGFTGQKVFIHPDEKEAYEAHVKSYLEEFDPLTGEERELLQQYTDHRWTLQQISVQQANIMTVIAALTNHHLESGEISSLGAALEPHTKLLNTYAIYEQRRRRAANDTLARFKEIHEINSARRAEDARAAAAIHLSFRECGETWDPKQFGFDCSVEEAAFYLNMMENKIKLEQLAKDGFEHLLGPLDGTR
jgi:hypothetical protein